MKSSLAEIFIASPFCIFQSKAFMNMKVKQGHGVSLLIACQPFVPFIFSVQFIKDLTNVRRSIQSPGDTELSKTNTL